MVALISCNNEEAKEVEEELVVEPVEEVALEATAPDAVTAAFAGQFPGMQAEWEQNKAEKTKKTRRGNVPTTPSDALKSIKGMATFVPQLQEMGITTFGQIGRWDDETVFAVAKALDISPGKIFRDDWVGQAQRLSGERT